MQLVELEKVEEHLRKRMMEMALNSVGVNEDAGVIQEIAEKRLKAWLYELRPHENSALDLIHSVVAGNAYDRGYGKGHEEGYERGMKDAAPKWIPFTAETMPKEDGEYFVLFDEEWYEEYGYGTGLNGIADFHGDCEAFGYWRDYYDPDSLGFVDSDFVEIKVKKWMPIPKDEEGKNVND